MHKQSPHPTLSCSHGITSLRSHRFPVCVSGPSIFWASDPIFIFQRYVIFPQWIAPLLSQRINQKPRHHLSFKRVPVMLGQYSAQGYSLLTKKFTWVPQSSESWNGFTLLGVRYKEFLPILSQTLHFAQINFFSISFIPKWKTVPQFKVLVLRQVWGYSLFLPKAVRTQWNLQAVSSCTDPPNSPVAPWTSITSRFTVRALSHRT